MRLETSCNDPCSNLIACFSSLNCFCQQRAPSRSPHLPYLHRLATGDYSLRAEEDYTAISVRIRKPGCQHSIVNSNMSRSNPGHHKALSISFTGGALPCLIAA